LGDQIESCLIAQNRESVPFELQEKIEDFANNQLM